MTCEDPDAGTFGSCCCTGAATAGTDGPGSDNGPVVADDVGIALLVPMAEDIAASVVGAATGCSACAVDEGGSGDGGGGAGGGAAGGATAALVCICGTCATAVEVVASVGVTTVGCSLTSEVVAAVRARERVHRLPLTVVIDSCGDAMQTTAQLMGKRSRQGLRRGDDEKELQAPHALRA